MAASPPLVALRDATVTFGGRPLFAGLNLAIGARDRLCLVGRNGSGKSTLVKVLAGLVALDGGERFVQPGARIAYLPQEPDLSGCASVRAFVAAGLPADEREAAGYRVDAILDGVRLDGARDPATLSGGEARRAALARVLVADPNVLLLDEPTNHLDLPTITWLEEELERFRGALLLISHDRAFLTRLARRTLWLDRGQLHVSDRPFAEFEAWQAEVFEAEAAAAHKLDRLIAAELKWLREGLTARRTRNMGRVRALHELRRTRAAWLRGDRQVRMAVAEADDGGRVVIEAENISKSFDTPHGPRPVVRNFSTRILRRDRIGVIGPNGAGKTTLLRLLTGQLPPDTGQVRLGANLQPVYFDQRRASLDPEATLRQTLCPHGGDTVLVGGRPRHVASYLRDFLFAPDRLESPVKSLSGGERNRLLLARLFAQPSNLLVLDEPTNDLDMDTLDLLEEVLGDYDGTLLLVSHDRDFLDRLVTSVIAVEGGGVVEEYAGGYSDYLVQRRPRPAATPAAKAPRPRERPPRPRAAPRRLTSQQRRELESLPARIEALGAELRQLEATLADPDLFVRDPAAFERTTRRLAAAQAELAAAEDRWLELETLREELEG